MRILPVILAMAAAGVFGSMARAQEPLPAIQKIDTSSGHFVVNGKPFLPLMSWAQNSRTYGKLEALGFNTHAGDADPAAAKAVGGYVITNFQPQWVKDDNILGWFYGDEPDMAEGKVQPKKPRTDPAAVSDKCKEIKAADPSRPVLITFTAGFTKEENDYSAEAKAKLYPTLIQNADAVGFDIYPIYGSGYATHLNWVGNGVAELRELAGPKRPVYAWIETSKGSQWMTYEKQPDVLPMHTRNETWQALINGAAAIGYFTHAWKPEFKEFAPTEEMQKELKRLNEQLTRLTPAILGEPAKAAITMKMDLSNGLLCQCKATTFDGATYIFALNKDLGPQGDKGQQFDPIKPRSGKAIFTVAGLKAGTAIEVVDENRSLNSQDGGFSDDFEPLAEHIYKFKP